MFERVIDMIIREVNEYMDHKVKHYEDILAGLIPDDTNPEKWTKETRPELHSNSSNWN